MSACDVVGRLWVIPSKRRRSRSRSRRMREGEIDKRRY